VTVAALYVDVQRGPYARMPGVDAWGVERDAALYPGPWPVVAHPPCGPWGSLRKGCINQRRDLGPKGVAQVREFGGVLEHPQGSALWAHCGLPRPFRAVPTFAPREWALSVRQVNWGHMCAKPTWLLFVGIDPRDVPPIPPPRAPTHTIGGSYRPGDRGYTGRPAMPAKMAHVTPPAFAEWLVACARAAT